VIVFLSCALAIAATTWIVGWWGVAVVGLVAGALLWRRRAIVWSIALAASVAWGALLLLDASSARFGALASSLAGVMRVPAPAIVIVTLLFAALLAWSAAVIGSEMGRVSRREGLM